MYVEDLRNRYSHTSTAVKTAVKKQFNTATRPENKTIAK